MSTLQIRVCGRFRIQQKLYQGKNSSVYIGKNVQSESCCAIKCEVKSINPSFVMNQGKILQTLQGGIGIPHLMWYGENGDFRFLVTELLGNNLQEYLDICGGKFSLKTTFMIAQKILSSIEFVHYKNFLHRDIKPANFVMGLGKKLHQIYAIDFAFSTTYIDPKVKQHRPNSVDPSTFVGTLKFASLNVLKGNKNSRRDDLQSLGLMLIYFLKGQLPWSGVGGQTVRQKVKNIRKIHEQTSLQQLCQGLPKQFYDYFAYCRSLKYQEIPDYTLLRRMFKERFIKQGYQFDYIYDWILIPLKLKNSDLSNRIPLNRFVKKEETSLSMKNYEYDFTNDFELTNNKIEQKSSLANRKAVQEEETPALRTKRIVSQMPRNKNSHQPPKGKNNKDDCTIF